VKTFTAPTNTMGWTSATALWNRVMGNGFWAGAALSANVPLKATPATSSRVAKFLRTLLVEE
jgi:hypothetical protein